MGLCCNQIVIAGTSDPSREMNETLSRTHGLRYLFVYGTLRKACRHEMHRVLERSARCIGNATVRGTLYDLGLYPGLVTSGDDADVVKGEVYALDPDRAQATLTDLDRYEGCATTDQEPHEYRRETVRARLVDGTEIAVVTYVLNRPHAGLLRIPDGDYVAWRQRGG
jgi:gamma-glutamylcyclotransferase (GGCT)/AIG2-like uncharacterized protein YtfP